MVDFIIKLVEELEKEGGAGSILPFVIILWCGALYLLTLLVTKVILPLFNFLQKINVKKTDSWSTINIIVLVLVLVYGFLLLDLVFTLGQFAGTVRESRQLLQERKEKYKELEEIYQRSLETEEEALKLVNRAEKALAKNIELKKLLEEARETYEKLQHKH